MPPPPPPSPPDPNRATERIYQLVIIVLVIVTTICFTWESNVLPFFGRGRSTCWGVAGHKLCFPADPGGHLVVFSGGNYTGSVELMISSAANCSYTDWSSNPAGSGGTTATSSALTFGSNPQTVPSTGTFSYGVVNDGCYYLKLDTGNSPVFRAGPNNQQSTIKGCKLRDDKWSFKESLEEDPC